MSEIGKVCRATISCRSITVSCPTDRSVSVRSLCAPTMPLNTRPSFNVMLLR